MGRELYLADGGPTPWKAAFACILRWPARYPGRKVENAIVRARLVPDLGRGGQNRNTADELKRGKLLGDRTWCLGMDRAVCVLFSDRERTASATSGSGTADAFAKVTWLPGEGPLRSFG